MTPSGTQALIIVSSYPPVPPDHSFDITPKAEQLPKLHTE